METLTQSRIEAAPSYVIHRTGRLLRIQLLQLFRDLEVDISPEHWFILFRLYDQDGLPQCNLTSDVFQDYPNITRLVNGLVERKLVTREASDEDRRQSLIYLTDTGHALIAKLLPHVKSTRNRVFKGMSYQDITTLNDLLNKIESNIMDSESL